MFTHIAVVRDLVDTQYKEYQEVSVHNTSNSVSGILGCDVWCFKGLILRLQQTPLL